MPSALRRADTAIAVRGLQPLMRALARVEGNAGKQLRRELRDIANDIRDTARAGVPHKTGRHGGSGTRLSQSIKSRVSTTGASVYSDAPHAIVQDTGGQVGHGALIKRADASKYMTEAVNDAQPYVNRRLDELLAEFGREFERN